MREATVGRRPRRFEIRWSIPRDLRGGLAREVGGGGREGGEGLSRAKRVGNGIAWRGRQRGEVTAETEKE